MSEIRENMDFEAKVLREQGVDFVDYPRFRESMERMICVAAVRQSFDKVCAGERIMDMDGTLEFLTSMMGNGQKAKIDALMLETGGKVLRAFVAHRAFIFGSLGIVILFGLDSMDGHTMSLCFIAGGGVTLYLRLRIVTKLESLKPVERAVVRFYKDLEQVVKSEGREGFLASPENMKIILEEIEAGLTEMAENPEFIVDSGSDFEKISGKELFDAMKNEAHLDRLLNGQRITAKETDSALRSLRSG